MINPLDLKGKRIMVTGASSGIGRGIAILLSVLGAEMILVARNTEKLQEVYAGLDKGEHQVIPFDLRYPDKTDELMRMACMNGKKLNGLVHSAGICPVIPIQNITTDKMLDIMTVNYFSFIELVKHFAKRKYSNGGSVVAISSVSSQAGWRGASIYCGSKGALDSSIRALSVELASKHIRINSIVPSNIKTDMFENIIKLTGDGKEDTITSKQPLGMGSVEDVAHAAAFLMSDASRFITGTSMVVDGGYLAQ